ncbi:MAG: NAD-dependent epimerase/dehydratase family protein [Methylococcales bacterium]|nr:NAD-dependent epimerase/dehydratase family protein [Methylococcales bacterium]MDP3840586.1 NAD-dependent epimerase/dehydratase family protein [Methylococcales bacterium]
MRCLVLGASGFIGSHLVKSLAVLGHQVAAYGRHFDSTNLGGLGANIEYITGDFCNEHRWDELLSGIQVCYHLISTTVPKSSNDDPIADVTGNVIGTLKLLEAAKKKNIRIVFTSSGGTVYGKINTDSIDEDHATDPLCSYGITKLTIEKYLLLYRELHSVRSVVLRIANPYGEGQQPYAIQGAVAVFMGRVLRGHTIDIWGDGSIIRDYVYVQDVVQAMIAASEYGGRLNVFNVGSGAGVSLLELLEMIEQVTAKKADIIFHPSRSFDVPRNVLNIAKAQKELSWTPQVPMIDGLKKTAIWMQEKLGEAIL